MLRNKSNRERQIPYDLTYMWNVKKQTNKHKLIDTENKLVVARSGGWELGKMGEVGQKIQTSSYKINKSWGGNVQHGD